MTEAEKADEAVGDERVVSSWSRSDTIGKWGLVLAVASSLGTAAFALGGSYSGGSAKTEALSKRVDELKKDHLAQISDLMRWRATAQNSIARMGNAHPAQMLVKLQAIQAKFDSPDSGWDTLGSDLDDLRDVGTRLTSRVQILEDDVHAHGVNFKTHRTLIEANAEAIRVLDGPIGTVVAWPSTSTAPKGWHLCDGSLLDIKGEKDPLYLALRETYATKPIPHGKVKLPDFRGMFLRGHGDKSGPIGKKQDDMVGSHQHDMPPLHLQVAGGQGSKAISGGDVKGPGFETGDVLTPHSETRPVNYAVHWIIRVK